MRIANAQIEHNEPHSADLLILTDGVGNTYAITGEELEELLIEKGNRCSECKDSGEIEEGEHDDIRTKKCICRQASE